MRTFHCAMSECTNTPKLTQWYNSFTVSNLKWSSKCFWMNAANWVGPAWIAVPRDRNTSL